MLKKILFALFVYLFFFFPVFSISAHQPRIVTESRTKILKPEISQAFYSKLSGSPDFYEIESEEGFNFYFGLLVPDLPDQKKNFSARIVKRENNGSRVIYVLDGLKTDWQPYFEKFAGDHYFKGPNWRQKLPGGSYSITVWNPENEGKYVLVVGERESFPFVEIVKTVSLLPKLKKDFFEKSPYTAFSNLAGLFLLFGFLVLIGLMVGLFFLFKKIKKNKINFMSNLTIMALNTFFNFVKIINGLKKISFRDKLFLILSFRALEPEEQSIIIEEIRTDQEFLNKIIHDYLKRKEFLEKGDDVGYYKYQASEEKKMKKMIEQFLEEEKSKQIEKIKASM